MAKWSFFQGAPRSQGLQMVSWDAPVKGIRNILKRLRLENPGSEFKSERFGSYDIIKERRKK